MHVLFTWGQTSLVSRTALFFRHATILSHQTNVAWWLQWWLSWADSSHAWKYGLKGKKYLLREDSHAIIKYHCTTVFCGFMNNALSTLSQHQILWLGITPGITRCPYGVSRNLLLFDNLVPRVLQSSRLHGDPENEAGNKNWRETSNLLWNLAVPKIFDTSDVTFKEELTLKYCKISG